MDLVSNLRMIRRERGLSQEDIADVLDTTQQQYSKYETGMQEIPCRHIITLCELYQVSSNYLLGIDIYMTAEEGNKKFNKLADEVLDLIEWAEYQEHISRDGADVLYNNLLTIKKTIEEEY